MHTPLILTRRRALGALACTAATLLGSQRLFAATGRSLVLTWNDAALDAIRRTRSNPPVAARALAIVHTAIYDAWAVYDERAIPTTAHTPRQPASERTPERIERAISHAAYTALVGLFPSETARFDAHLHAAGCECTDRSRTGSDPAAIGNRAATAVLNARRDDGANQANGYADTSNYQPINSPDKLINPDRWQPMYVSDGKGGFKTQKFIVPHWAQVRPFALTSAAQFRPPAPLRHGTPAFVRQAEALIALSAGLDDRQKLIVEYWVDGPGSETPPGHWCLLAQSLCTRDHHSLAQDVQMYFILANAVFDASIAAWDSKRAYDAVRPYTAIRQLFAEKPLHTWAGVGKGTGTLLGDHWLPYQLNSDLTPPHPEYVSGHSTFSAAAAEVLMRFTGSDRFGAWHTQKARTCKIEPGLVPAADTSLYWSTFTAAAQEAGLSRRLGGIHFEAADREGQKLGRQVGAAVYAKAQAYITGRLS